MFKSKVIDSVFYLLVGGVCGCVFVCVAEYLSGSEAYVAWAYTAVIGIAGLVFVLVSRRRK